MHELAIRLAGLGRIFLIAGGAIFVSAFVYLMIQIARRGRVGDDQGQVVTTHDVFGSTDRAARGGFEEENPLQPNQVRQHGVAYQRSGDETGLDACDRIQPSNDFLCHGVSRCRADSFAAEPRFWFLPAWHVLHRFRAPDGGNDHQGPVQGL